MNQDIKKRALHRAKIIEGKMKGLIKAIDREDYCIDLITQSLSLQKSLTSLDALFLKNHLQTHVKEQMKKGDNRAVEELVKIYTLSNK